MLTRAIRAGSIALATAFAGERLLCCGTVRWGLYVFLYRRLGWPLSAGDQAGLKGHQDTHMAMVGRKDWVQADLRCLMCGRVLGRLVGPLPADYTGRSMCGRPPRFAAF